MICTICGTPLRADNHGTLIDTTGGDVCTAAGDDAPHQKRDREADAFVSLRARYEALMDMEIGAEPIAVAVWVEALDTILTDAKLAGINPMEVTHR